MEPNFLFVLEGRDITGFITIHDFNKQPARGHLYLLLAQLESAMASLVRLTFSHRAGDVLALLSADSREKLDALYQADLRQDAESDLVAYLTFADLLTVIGSDAGLRRQIPDMTRSRWKATTGGLAELRNQVMHPVRNV